MPYFLFHAKFLVCPVEKQVSSAYGMKSELFVSASQSLFLWWRNADVKKSCCKGSPMIKTAVLPSLRLHP